MARKNEFGDYLLELLAPLDGVRLRAMFGGQGLFQNETMFGLIADDTLYLKVDGENQAQFEAAAMAPFTYRGKGKAIKMSYFETPPDALEDSEALMPWAESAIAASRRANKPKRRKPHRGKGE